MNRCKLKSYFLVFFLLIVSTSSSNNFQYDYGSDNEILLSSIQQRILLINLNGFQQNYIKDYDLKNFKQFQLKSANSKYMVPDFPGLFLPNFWSSMTGYHVDKHGIVSNNFYDPILKQKFDQNDYSYSRLKLWSNYDPIWIDTVKNNLKTGVLFWPQPHEMIHDPFYRKQNHENNHNNNNNFKWDLTFNEKIDITVDLFKSEGFEFCVINHNEPNMASFKYGIGSLEFNRTIIDLDQSMGYFMKKLKTNGLMGTTDFNTIIMSNHGNFL